MGVLGTGSKWVSKRVERVGTMGSGMYAEKTGSGSNDDDAKRRRRRMMVDKNAGKTGSGMYVRLLGSAMNGVRTRGKNDDTTGSKKDAGFLGTWSDDDDE